MKKTSLISALALGIGAMTLLAGTASADGRNTDRNDSRRGAAIELFEHPNFKGQSIRLDTAAPTLGNMRFNDRVSSVRVREGVWQVCTDANYRGRCETIRSDQRKLATIRLNDNVSSVRRLDRQHADRRDDRHDQRDQRYSGNDKNQSWSKGNDQKDEKSRSADKRDTNKGHNSGPSQQKNGR